MEIESTIATLNALAQGTRLNVFRLLVRHEPDGMAAGDIARALDVPQNTMSAHLGILARAGLLRSERHSRSIIYRADLDGLRALTLFLLKDCCAGMSCPLLSGPSTMTVWIKEGTTNASEEAQAGGDHRQAA